MQKAHSFFTVSQRSIRNILWFRILTNRYLFKNDGCLPSCCSFWLMSFRARGRVECSFRFTRISLPSVIVVAGGCGAFYLPLVDNADDENHSGGCQVDELQTATVRAGSRRGVPPPPSSGQTSLSKSTGALNSTNIHGRVRRITCQSLLACRCTLPGPESRRQNRVSSAFSCMMTGVDGANHSLVDRPPNFSGTSKKSSDFPLVFRKKDDNP
jgi:hypothetical protein